MLQTGLLRRARGCFRPALRGPVCLPVTPVPPEPALRPRTGDGHCGTNIRKFGGTVSLVEALGSVMGEKRTEQGPRQRVPSPEPWAPGALWGLWPLKVLRQECGPGGTETSLVQWAPWMAPLRGSCQSPGHQGGPTEKGRLPGKEHRPPCFPCQRFLDFQPGPGSGPDCPHLRLWRQGDQHSPMATIPTVQGWAGLRGAVLGSGAPWPGGHSHSPAQTFPWGQKDG